MNWKDILDAVYNNIRSSDAIAKKIGGKYYTYGKIPIFPDDPFHDEDVRKHFARTNICLIKLEGQRQCCYCQDLYPQNLFQFLTDCPELLFMQVLRIGSSMITKFDINLLSNYINLIISSFVFVLQTYFLFPVFSLPKARNASVLFFSLFFLIERMISPFPFFKFFFSSS